MRCPRRYLFLFTIVVDRARNKICQSLLAGAVAISQRLSNGSIGNIWYACTGDQVSFLRLPSHPTLQALLLASDMDSEQHQCSHPQHDKHGKVSNILPSTYRASKQATVLPSSVAYQSRLKIVIYPSSPHVLHPGSREPNNYR
jgi:hypothetical protein